MKYDVIIPCFNAANFIGEAVQSIQEQSVTAQRIIAVDDGSTDNTLAMLEKLLPPGDVFSQENTGPGAACMTAIGHSTSPVLAFIDADDLWLPHKMAQQLQRLAQERQPTAHFGLLEAFNDDPDVTLTVDEAHAGWSRTTMVLKRTTFDQVGPFVDMPNKIGEMVAWLGRARDADVELAKSDEVLARRRLHSGSLTRRVENPSDGYLSAARQAIMRRRKAKYDESAQ